LQRIRVGIVGLGKIALEEHVPALRANGGYELVACVGARGRLENVPCFDAVSEMLDAVPGLDAVAICTPPQAHFEAAGAALRHGKHVLLEKPPCVTVAEVDELVALSESRGVTLFQTWHARETEAVDAAARWLSGRQIHHGTVVWKEDVRQWHPRQTWIWQAGGFGVLDAGINAISILTKIVPETMAVETARLLIPSNCESPIAAALTLRLSGGALIEAEFDFRHRGTQTRTIDLDTDAGALNLARYGAELGIDGTPLQFRTQQQEYAALYRRFSKLVAEGRSDTDKRPLELVADVFRVAERATIEPFLE
jgi:predicted dehydrogenase